MRIGVLISVTTIPAAGNIGVALAYSNWDEVGGAFVQLSLNLLALLIAATGTLSAERAYSLCQRERAVREHVALIVGFRTCVAGAPVLHAARD